MRCRICRSKWATRMSKGWPKLRLRPWGADADAKIAPLSGGSTCWKWTSIKVLLQKMGRVSWMLKARRFFISRISWAKSRHGRCIPRPIITSRGSSGRLVRPPFLCILRLLTLPSSPYLPLSSPYRLVFIRYLHLKSKISFLQGNHYSLNLQVSCFIQIISLKPRRHPPLKDCPRRRQHWSGESASR